MAASTSRNKMGINILLAAEKEAQEIVSAARTEKQARFKQAKEEADKEIAEFRTQMEADYQMQLLKIDTSANVKCLEEETEKKIDHLKKEVARISPDVVSMLLKHVTTVKN